MCSPASVGARALYGGRYPVRAQRLCCVARGTFLIRAALFAARCQRRCRSGRRKPWRERPRCARPTWPRACPEGSLTPWLSLSLQVVGHSMFGAEKRRVLLHRTRSNVTQILRTIRFRGPLAVQEMVVRAGCIRCRLAAVEVITSGRDVNAVGHHDDDAASVLGTVQGAALRSARAYARPSGLDGACAQMIGRHLRDGHRMLFPSGRNGALIHPSNSREKRSHMFDRFRMRAFHPLVEVHFSRFAR
jgi:hypothetical protein